jgi:hypothetical protein
MMEFRHELKFLMHPHDAAVLKKQLSVMMELDLNGDAQGRYMVRSLYFDTLAGSAFFDKLDGVEYRRKYRIRYYNNDTKFIRLESKLKIDGELGPILLNHNSVLSDFILDMKLNGLKPSVIVDYQRTAYLHQSLDVRITFDEQIRSRIYDTQLFKTKFGSVEVLEPGDVVLEVKYDELIPRFIADILRQVPMTRLAVSKYAYCYNKK